MKRMVQPVIGHSGLNKHLYTISCADDPRECGLEKETGLHFVVRCPRYRAIRYAVFDCTVLSEKILPDLKLPELMYFLEKTGRLP